MRWGNDLSRGDKLFLVWLVVVMTGSLIWWFVWAPDFPAKGTVAGGWIGGAYVLWRTRLSDRDGR